MTLSCVTGDAVLYFSCVRYFSFWHAFMIVGEGGAASTGGDILQQPLAVNVTMYFNKRDPPLYRRPRCATPTAAAPGNTPRASPHHGPHPPYRNRPPLPHPHSLLHTVTRLQPSATPARPSPSCPPRTTRPASAAASDSRGVWCDSAQGDRPLRAASGARQGRRSRQLVRHCSSCRSRRRYALQRRPGECPKSNATPRVVSCACHAVTTATASAIM